jgi:hypothetical protein
MIAFSRIALASLAIVGSIAPAAAIAQPYSSPAPLTRAQVRADLVEWLQAGFQPLDVYNYPENALQAGAIVAQRRAERAGATGQMPMQTQQTRSPQCTMIDGWSSPSTPPSSDGRAMPPGTSSPCRRT